MRKTTRSKTTNKPVLPRPRVDAQDDDQLCTCCDEACDCEDCRGCFPQAADSGPRKARWLASPTKAPASRKPARGKGAAPGARRPSIEHFMDVPHCPFCGQNLKDEGEEFLRHVAGRRSCREEWEAWKDRINEDWHGGD